MRFTRILLKSVQQQLTKTATIIKPKPLTSERFFDTIPSVDTILLFTDLCSGSRIPTLRGARAAAAEHDLQVQVVELARVKVPLAKTLAFWKPVGCLIEGSSHIRPSSPLLKKLPVVHIDPNAKILAAKPAFTVRNDNAGIAERAIKVLLRAGVEHFAFVGWTRDVNWSTDRYETFRETLAALGKDCAALLDPWTMGNAADFIAREGEMDINVPTVYLQLLIFSTTKFGVGYVDEQTLTVEGDASRLRGREVVRLDVFKKLMEERMQRLITLSIIKMGKNHK